jgi:hypothetical protein
MRFRKDSPSSARQMWWKRAGPSVRRAETRLLWLANQSRDHKKASVRSPLIKVKTSHDREAVAVRCMQLPARNDVRKGSERPLGCSSIPKKRRGSRGKIVKTSRPSSEGKLPTGNGRCKLMPPVRTVLPRADLILRINVDPKALVGVKKMHFAKARASLFTKSPYRARPPRVWVVPDRSVRYHRKFAKRLAKLKGHPFWNMDVPGLEWCNYPRIAAILLTIASPLVATQSTALLRPRWACESCLAFCGVRGSHYPGCVLAGKPHKHSARL